MKTRWLISGVAFMASIAAVSCNEGLKSHSSLQREWDSTNAPARMGLVDDGYEVAFSKLPTQGRLTRIPWSGDYWATYKGGTAYRWAHSSRAENTRIYYDTIPFDKLSRADISQLSPTEKYDILSGDKNYSMTKAERARTNVFKQLSGSSIPKWFGLCHAWAPATLMYANPRPVTLKNDAGLKVKFGSSDIKALLTLYLHQTSSPNYFVSRRCNIDDKELRNQLHNGSITLADYNLAMTSAECRGINAGAYHIILANMIAVRDEGFVADVTRGAEVWNQSVSGYKARILKERTTISAQAAPGTVKEVLVETVMVYTQEIDHSWDRVQVPQSNKSVSYRYWLELDREGSIIGGLWVSDMRPDFLWRRDRPSPEFAGKWASLGKLVKASTSDIADGSDVSQPGDTSHGSGSTGGSQYLSAPTKWKISKFMFAYIIDLDVFVTDKVERVVLETVKQNGQVHKHHTLKKRRDGSFRLHNLPVAQWKAGLMRVVGYSKSEEILFTFEKNYSR